MALNNIVNTNLGGNDGAKNTIQSMKEKKVKNVGLIPKIDKYIDNNCNVMLIGQHGVGKSYSLMDAATERGLTMKYYSCSTLDPFTDLVGVPYPSENGEELKMIRPRDIDQANIIFFDELNRAQDVKTLNAILEIIQFRSINGEKLPNLQAVWAAINPVDDENTYDVHDLDPALVDRFDVFVEIKPAVSVAYLSTFMDKKIAIALNTWWTELRRTNKDIYISPRRIEKIGRLVDATGDTGLVRNMMPLGQKVNTGELIDMLNVATGKKKASDPSVGAFAAGGMMGGVDYTDRKSIQKNVTKIVADIKNGTISEDNLNKIDASLSKGVGSDKLIDVYGPILNELPTPHLEKIMKGFAYSKKSGIRSRINSVDPRLTTYGRIESATWS